MKKPLYPSTKYPQDIPTRNSSANEVLRFVVSRSRTLMRPLLGIANIKVYDVTEEQRWMYNGVLHYEYSVFPVLTIR